MGSKIHHANFFSNVINFVELDLEFRKRISDREKRNFKESFSSDFQ